MSAPWKPGDVAVLTWYADEPMISLRVGGQCGHFGKAEHWHTERGTHGVSPDIARRLVVIDPDDGPEMDRLTDLMGWALHPADAPRFANVLREFANPAPPIEEPRGLGAVVEDADGLRWLSHRAEVDIPWSKPWYCCDLEEYRDFGDTKAVRVLSEGVR